MPNRPFRPIATGLIQRVIALAVLCFVLMGSIHALIEFHSGKAAFETTIQDIAKASVPQLSVGLWDIELEAVKKQLAVIASRPEVAFVELSTLTGERFEVGDKSLRLGEIKTKIEIPYPKGDGMLGNLQITGNDAFRHAKIVRDIAQMLLGYFVFVTAICLAIVILLRRKLQLPLAQLARFTYELVPGEAPGPANLERASNHYTDEVDVLADGFRTLQKTVFTHVSNLDHIVATRTAELALHNQILDQISQDVPLLSLLDSLVRQVEWVHPKVLCSILLLDKDGKHLRHGAAPSLPSFYTTAIDGLAIGDSVGSCGAAAYRKERVVAEDVQTHPNWAPYRELASQANVQSCWSQPIIGTEGQVLGTFALYHRQPAQPSTVEIDLIERYAKLAALAIERKRAGERFKTLSRAIAQSPVSIVITDPTGCIDYVNPKFEEVTGYASAEAIGRTPRMISSGEKSREEYDELWRTISSGKTWTGDFHNRRKDGTLFWEHATISPILDEQGTLIHFVAVKEDITQRKEYQRQLEHIAHYDMLTSMPNRALLADRLRLGMAQAQRREEKLAVVYLDLDGFKTVNDQYGHTAGDQLLITVAMRMKQALREVDTLARIGGDEFVAVLNGLEGVNECLPMLNRMLEAASLPVVFGDLVLRISASLGVTFYPQAHETDADQLMRQADHAMYQAKVSGKNRYHVFDAEKDSDIRDHHESLENIRLALSNDEFVLHYQPKINMRTGAIIGAEALIRWQHPELGLLAPAKFLPVIEDHPLAVDIGEWVIHRALSQMEVWQADGLEISVSVNIGARQLQQPDFPMRLRALLASHPKVKPGDLGLEVLETSALEDIEHVSSVMKSCKAMGVTFALDDFGTGYSSLTYLKRLPVDLLKIDQSFVRDMLEDPDDLAILHGVIGLAAAFKCEVIAEGVESTEQGTALLNLGCELAQGYGIARPMSAEQLHAWAAKRPMQVGTCVF
jgi:diguanylate cyclase (GGDEF)-like protein/PAS domain S-box-containing protein